MNHRSIPSLSSSISSHDSPSSTSTPRTSSSSMFRMYGNKLTYSHSLKIPTASIPIEQKRYSEPPPVTTKRWDDSQLEMVLAEDDFIQPKVRRNSSLRLKEKLQLSESFIKDKLRSHRNSSNKKSFRKRVYDWLF